MPTWFHYMFTGNTWGFGHLLLAVLVTTIVWRAFFYNHANIWANPRQSLRGYLWKWRLIGLVIIIVVVVGWEVWEYWYESARFGLTPDHIYGSMIRYWYDTIGDILLGILGFIIGVI